MSKYALMLAAALMLTPVPPVRAQAAAPVGAPVANASESVNHVAGYTAWDDDFFYVSVQVNKPTLSGKNSLPFSNPLEDDAVIFGIQIDNDHAATRPTQRTVFVVASATGGAQLYTGVARTPLFNGLADINRLVGEINQNKSFSRAEQDAARAALFGRVIKFAIVPKGVQRASGSNVPGYTVEIAIPWNDLGGRPAVNTRMGFAVAAQSIVAGSPPLQSLSPRVRVPNDVQNPSLWGEILFNSAALPSRPDMLVSPRMFANKPVIDGEISNGEWNNLSAFSFGLEMGTEAVAASAHRTSDARLRPAFTPRPARPAVPLPTPGSISLPLTAHQPQPLAHLVMARYAYRYQADPRKAAPLAGVTRGNGSTALAHHPLEGVGPWFSYDRVDWHRSQLKELRKAGIDVILPEYRGDTHSRQLYADKGLRVLASALQNLRQTEQDYPLVALYLDTNSLNDSAGSDKPDLKQPATQAALYGMIRDFYRVIPAPFRSQITLAEKSLAKSSATETGNAPGNGSRVAYPIFLSSAGAFKDLDSTFVDYVRGRFARDFEGADLLILGNSDFKAKAALDGYFTDTKEKGFQFDGGGWIKTASIGAGYDASYQEYSSGDASAVAAPFLPRRNGDTLRQNWKAALQQKPDWVLLDGWNDYDVAAEIAPTLETGYSASDITREYTRLYMGLTKRNAHFLWHDAPGKMQSGRAYTINVRAENTGIEPWTSGAASGTVSKTAPAFGVPVLLAYRWLRNGMKVAEGTSAFINAEAMTAGRSANSEMTISTLSGSASPLPAGDYTLEVRLAEVDKKKAAEGAIGDGSPGTTLQIPVTITEGSAGKGLTAYAATEIRSDLPQFLEAGSAYTANVTLRNDGAQTWRKSEGARITLRLFRVVPSETAGGEPTVTPISIPDTTAELAADVPPGQTMSARITIPATDADGKPLPLWKQDDSWTYMARWEIAEGKSGSSQHPDGALTPPQPVSVVEFDFGARFAADGTPLMLPAERRLPVRMSIQNTGPQIWKKDQVRIGYHWYYQDGSEFIFEDETTPITQDVAPGNTVGDMIVWITSPPYDGTYNLVWDVKVGDTWASTQAASRPFDQITRSVQVRGGKLVFADLSKAYNVDGIAEEDNPTDGDLDGQGHTLPASLMPPFATGAIVPSGMWLPSERSGPDSTRRISFRWGDKEAKSKNFIACRGQRIELGKTGGRCSTLHILAASTGKDISGSVKLIFQEPTSQSEDLYSFLISRWDQIPTRGEEIGFISHRLQSLKGIQNSTVMLYHYSIKVKEPRNLVALQLPNLPDVKIAAITLEK